MGNGSGSAGIRNLYSRESFISAFRCRSPRIGSLRLEGGTQPLLAPNFPFGKQIRRAQWARPELLPFR
jgi:hypothetical protein